MVDRTPKNWPAPSVSDNLARLTRSGHPALSRRQMIPLERGLGAEVGRSDSPNKELRGSERLLAGGDQSRPHRTQDCKI